MAYVHLDFERVPDLARRSAFERADLYLHDVYGMFRGLPPADGDGGGGNYSIALALTCVIDGLAQLRWPLAGVGERFADLISQDFWWPAEWMAKEKAAKQIYYEFRNMLVHELAADRATDWRPKGYAEPIAGRWGEIPDEQREIATIDSLISWDVRWPILFDHKDSKGNPCYKLAAASLYWAVKDVAKRMVVDEYKTP